MIRVLVLDAYSGGGSMIGKATLQALVSSKSTSRFAGSKNETLEICTAVEDPSKTDVEGVAKRLTIPTPSDAGFSESDWSNLFEDFHRIFVVTPKIQDPVPFTTSVINAASKMSNLELLLLSSNTLAGSNTTVGQQCQHLEDYTRKMFEPEKKSFCIVRIPSSPLFLDHLNVYASHIQKYGGLMDPRDPSKPFWTVAVPDVANACATILSAPSDNLSTHQQQTYHLVASPPWSLNELANLLTQKLDRPPIQANRVPYEDAKKGMLSSGYMPEWQVEIVIQLFQMLDSQDDDTVVPGAIEAITGQKPTSMEDWINENISEFQGEIEIMDCQK